MLAPLGDPEFEFENVPGLAPFRRLASNGSVTSASAIFAGLDSSAKSLAGKDAFSAAVRSDPCAAFFGQVRPAPVPVAMFSDFGCPVCRIMDSRLDELAVEAPGSFRVVRHQLPILGSASQQASRAVLAADRQGAYREMHARLIRSPAVTDESYIAAMAERLNLDHERLLSDMASEDISRQLQMSAAIADEFGFYGTPAFAIGRTVFMGSLSTPALRHLIREESDSPCLTA